MKYSNLENQSNQPQQDDISKTQTNPHQRSTHNQERVSLSSIILEDHKILEDQGDNHHHSPYKQCKTEYEDNCNQEKNMNQVMSVKEEIIYKINKSNLNETKRLFEMKYQQRELMAHENRQNKGSFHLEKTKKTIEMSFLSKIEESILLFNAKQFEESFHKLKRSNIIMNINEYTQILMLYKGFDRNIFGDLLARDRFLNKSFVVTQIFMKLLDMKDDIVYSIRVLASFINMPQDSSLMLVIIDYFSKEFYSQFKGKDYKDVNDVYLLICSILSLNSLFHNTCHKEKMDIDKFVLINSSLSSSLTRRIYEEIKINKIETIYDYTSLFYKVAHNPNEIDSFDKIYLLKEGLIFKRYSLKKNPQDVNVFLSKNEKRIIIKPYGTCLVSVSESSFLVDDFEMVYMGRGGVVFQKYRIEETFEQNCITLIFKNKSIFLRHDDDNTCKKWFKALKYLLLMTKSKKKLKEGNENFDQTKKLENGYLSKEIILAIWKTEIVPHWLRYRVNVVNDDSLLYIEHPKQKKVMFDFFNMSNFVKNMKEETKQYFQSGKYDFYYIWSLGIPEILRMKIWKVVIGNSLSVSGVYFNSFTIPDIEFEEIIEKYNKRNCHSQLSMSFPLSFPYSIPNNNFQSSIKMTETPFIDFDEELLIMLSKGQFDDVTVNLSVMILSDILNYRKLFQKTINRLSINESTFFKDIFTCIFKLLVHRQDLSYSTSLLLISIVIYLNSSSVYDSFTTLINFIYSKRSKFLLSFWEKNENFIKIRFDYFQNLLTSLCPEVINHMKKMEFSIKLFFINWIETIFSEAIDEDGLFRVWDMFLLKGEVVLYEISLGIVKFQEKELTHLLINDLINRLIRPPFEYINHILDMISNNEISLEDSFYIMQKEEKVAYEKGILLQTYFIEEI